MRASHRLPLSSGPCLTENGVMQTSTDRILTTHTGSLPRPDGLLEKLLAIGLGADPASLDFNAACAGAVRDVVAKQVETGIDIVSDGEMSKPGYTYYVRDRMSGLEAFEDPPRGCRGARFSAISPSFPISPRRAISSGRKARNWCRHSAPGLWRTKISSPSPTTSPT